jgi:hypothetical protein
MGATSMTDLKSDSTHDLQVALKIDKGIRDYEDDLVEKIEKAFEAQYGLLDPSQYQNLLQVSLSTESAEVIKNFLRYQVGRETKWGRGKDSLAEAIIACIQGDLKTQATEIAKQAGAPEKLKEVHIQLIRRYLGYGKRHLVFLKPKQSRS